MGYNTTGAAIGGQVAHEGRGAADRGERGEAAGASAPKIRKLSGAAAKKIEPQFSALFGF
jgi:hypothetical protein